MYTVEEIKNKVKTGTWIKEDVARCVEDLKQISDFTVYTEVNLLCKLWCFLPIIFGNMLIL